MSGLSHAILFGCKIRCGLLTPVHHFKCKQTRVKNQFQKIQTNPSDEQAQNSEEPKNRELGKFHSLREDNQKLNPKAIKAKLASVDDEIV